MTAVASNLAELPARPGAAVSRLSIGLGILTGQVLPGSPVGVGEEYRAIPMIARAAEANGFESVWLSEHHFADDAYMPSLLPILAAISPVTSTIALGTAVMIPALHDPIRLAEDVAVVDQLSQGRVRLGLGLGWRVAEFRTFGVPLRERVARTEETVAILRHLWSDNTEPFRGRFHSIDRPRLRPLPATPGGPPIYLAGSAEAPIRRAAAIADGLLYSRTGPTAAAVQPTRAHIDDALDWIAAVRGPARAASFPVALLLSVAVSNGDPWSVVARGVDHQFAAYARWKHEDAGKTFSAEAAQAAAQAGRALMIAGTPADVAAQLRRWIDAVLPRHDLHLIVKLHYPGATLAETTRVLELFGRDVMPVLRSAAAGGAA